ncbi:hypothetical protein AB0M05_47330 [Streptomyces violaceusniger]|uniref:hypothetical protein n=1 Tax=Streptomyces violaceusniger TaxID=68280 RepID=UPI00343F4FF2
MTAGTSVDSQERQKRRDRARAFVPELIPEPADLDRSGPLDVREQRDLERIHAARDNHQNARWMRGKALEAAFRRRLYRGEDGTRTRQGYLDDEWDGISESAAYLEIREWRLAEQIADTCERPAPDSHVRALVDVAEAQDCETVAQWYAELRRYGKETGRRVTAQVVASLADYLVSESTSELDNMFALDSMFAPRQLPPTKPRKQPSEPTKRSAGEPVAGKVLTPGDGSFQNFGMSRDGEPGGSPASTEPGSWTLSAEHVDQLSAWLAVQARRAGISPDRAADFLMEALANDVPLRDWIQAHAEPGR